MTDQPISPEEQTLKDCQQHYFNAIGLIEASKFAGKHAHVVDVTLSFLTQIMQKIASDIDKLKVKTVEAPPEKII